MARPRLVLLLTLVASLCLALAAGAGAKPHRAHKASPLSVDALRASHLKEVKVSPAKAKVGTLKAGGAAAETFTVTVTAAG